LGDASANGGSGNGGLLQVSEERSEGGALTLAIEGELDLATAPKVREPLERAIEAGTRQVVIDMLGCGFIDSTGLGVLLHAAKRLEEDGGAMALVCVDDQIKRLLELTMIDRTIPVFATREKALAEISGTAAAEGGGSE
jgi:anti-sigma B factor antagonist